MAVVFVLCADDRQVGRISDSVQMIQTAVALATTGEVGVARGIELVATSRSEGDAVGRYGLGMSLAQGPAALVAPAVDGAFRAGGSQFLFLVAPILFGLLAAAGAGRIAGLLGAGERGQAIAVLLSSIGSPLGAYAICDLSESLQAALLAAGMLFALQSRREAAPRTSLGWAAAAGAAVGAAVLTKSGLVVVAPFTLLPLLAPPARGAAPGTWARVAACAGGSVPPLALFVGADWIRFGGLFQGYAGESFSYPFLVGAARLLVLPNKGLLFFFPALVAGLFEAARRVRPVAVETEAADTPAARRLEVAAGLLPLGALLGLAAPWWAWSGIAGWGPRLLVPALPLVSALAACAVERWRRPWALLLVGGSIALNALSFAQSAVSVFVFKDKLASVAVSEEVSRRFPRSEGRAPDGSPLVPGAFVINEVPLASDHVVHAWFLWVRAAGSDQERARRLERMPWASSRPDLVSIVAPLPPAFVTAIAPPLGVGFLGRSLFGAPSRLKGKVYVESLANQVFRAQQQRRLDRALRLSTRLFALDPRASSAALLSESFRLLGRHETLRAFLDSLGSEVRETPPVFAVMALAARDSGETEAAKAFMKRATDLRTPAVKEALVRSPSEWPPDFVSLMSDEDLSIEAALPGLGEKPR